MKAFMPKRLVRTIKQEELELFLFLLPHSLLRIYPKRETHFFQKSLIEGGG